MNHLLNVIVLVVSLTIAAQANIGHIEVTINSASLNSTLNTPTFVVVCIRNSTKNYEIPMQNRTDCINFISTLAPENNAVWNYTHKNAKNYNFSDQSQIIFEVYDEYGEFLGISDLTIKNLLAHGQNRIEVTMPLRTIDNKNHRTLNSTIAWIPNLIQPNH